MQIEPKGSSRRRDAHASSRSRKRPKEPNDGGLSARRQSEMSDDVSAIQDNEREPAASGRSGKQKREKRDEKVNAKSPRNPEMLESIKIGTSRNRDKYAVDNSVYNSVQEPQRPGESYRSRSKSPRPDIEGTQEYLFIDAAP